MQNQLKKLAYLIRPIQRILIVVGISLGFILLSIVSNVIYARFSNSDPLDSAFSDSDCNVVGINLHGDIYTYLVGNNSEGQVETRDDVSSEDITSYIRGAEDDENIKAILIEADSFGGSPLAGEEIANTLKEAKKPTVALVRQAGLSAAYWAISSADRIFASKNSDVGSIGVTSSYLENVSKNEREGLKYIQLISGKYKDAGSSDKPLTFEERNLFLRDLKIIHQNFIDAVSVNRNLPKEKVEAIADGSSVLGEKAKELGLIDEIGSWKEAEDYIRSQINETPEICWY